MCKYFTVPALFKWRFPFVFKLLTRLYQIVENYSLGRNGFDVYQGLKIFFVRYNYLIVNFVGNVKPVEQVYIIGLFNFFNDADRGVYRTSGNTGSGLINGKYDKEIVQYFGFCL